MTDPVPSKERMPHWTCKTHGDFDARVAVGCPECVRQLREDVRRWENAHKVVMAERDLWKGRAERINGLVLRLDANEGLLPGALAGLQRLAKVAGGAAPEPGEVATDAERWQTYLKCYDREEMVAAEWDGPAAITAFIDSQRLAQPPGDGQG